MKEFDRQAFPVDPELKPLHANLRRIGIAQYLCSEPFDHLMLEINKDEDWYSCLNHCDVNKLSVALDYEEPLYLLINIFYADLSIDEAGGIIIKIILDFLKWNTSPVEVKKLCESMNSLGVDEELIKTFSSQAKKINKVKTQAPNVSNAGKREANKVFIIHGHDKVARLELEKLLKEFKLDPIVLQDTPGESLDTIISKFERAAKECVAAIALFTPDDELKDGMFRPRQNVVLELGYFMGRDQQQDRKIIILKRNPIEGPSDIHGIETFNFEKSVEEVSMKLQKQLKHWNIIK